MKKIIFWIITDVLLYAIFILLSFVIIFKYIKYLDLGGGDAGMVALFLLFLAVLINSFFILLQWLHTFFSEINKQRYLKRKVIFFIIHSVLLFIWEFFLELDGAFKDDNMSFDWFFGLIFFVAVSNIIYYYMVKELGKKMKWGGENE